MQHQLCTVHHALLHIAMAISDTMMVNNESTYIEPYLMYVRVVEWQVQCQVACSHPQKVHLMHQRQQHVCVHTYLRTYVTVAFGTNYGKC